ncbi:hypothetical protein [Streptomyces sp. NPDC046909]|uniref:hypothetical protein n=1 Tax=Streptomyces sp. NPDC046909 TaxID=3155617 RepID=UPI0033E35A60
MPDMPGGCHNPGRSPVRFHDPGLDLSDLSGSAVVRCPRCDRIAHFERSAPPQPRVICRSCGLGRATKRCGCGCMPSLWLRASVISG